MSDLLKKSAYLKITKKLIYQSIKDKGYPISEYDTFRNYANIIAQISGGYSGMFNLIWLAIPSDIMSSTNGGGSAASLMLTCDSLSYEMNNFNFNNMNMPELISVSLKEA